VGQVRRLKPSLPHLTVAPAALTAAAVALGAATAPAASAQGGALGAKLRKAIAPAGGAAGAYVVDITDGQTLYALRAQRRRAPASVEKLYTTSTAIRQFGADGRLVTAVLGAGALGPDGVYRGDLYLRGGGDPTFGSDSFAGRAYGEGATVQQLARALVAKGIRRVEGRVVGDETYFDTLRGGPDKGYRLDSEVGGELSALAYNRGLANEQGSAFQLRPAAFAAEQMDDALGSAGVPVDGEPTAAASPPGAQELARAESPPMAVLIRLTNRPSDNFFAEMLLKGLGAKFGGEGSTRAGATVVRSTVAPDGISARFVDGSGLSRANQTSPLDVVRLLTAMAKDPNAAAFDGSLAVAGRNGTLSRRMRGTPAAGRCRAKTGTLSNVSALAGYCRARNGHELAFAFIMNGGAIGTYRAAQDQAAATLARQGG